jgi:hypothetical protein
MLEALKTINGATRLCSGILGDRNHGFDPASVFLSKIGLFCRSLIPFHGKRETYFRRKNPAVSISKFLSPEMPLYGESAVTAAPMFEHAGRNGKVYWGDKEAKGPMVVLWDSLTDEGKKECLEELKTTNDWVVWRMDSTKGDEDLMLYLTEVGMKEFRGKAARGQEEQKETSGEEMPLKGRAQKGRGWWR